MLSLGLAIASAFAFQMPIANVYVLTALSLSLAFAVYRLSLSLAFAVYRLSLSLAFAVYRLYSFKEEDFFDDSEDAMGFAACLIVACHFVALLFRQNVGS